MTWNCSKVRAARAARTARTARLFFPTLPIKFLIGSVVFVVAVGDAKSSYHQLLFVLFAKYDHCYDFAISTSNRSCGLFSCRPIRSRRWGFLFMCLTINWRELCSELRLCFSLVLLDIETSELWTACVQKYRR